MHPPPLPAWPNFTLMVERTPESSRWNSVYSVYRHIYLFILYEKYGSSTNLLKSGSRLLARSTNLTTIHSAFNVSSQGRQKKTLSLESFHLYTHHSRRESRYIETKDKPWHGIPSMKTYSDFWIFSILYENCLHFESTWRDLVKYLNKIYWGFFKVIKRIMRVTKARIS